MKKKYLRYLISGLMIISGLILLLVMINLGESSPTRACKTDADCRMVECGAECGLVCKSGSCIYVKCEDHGTLKDAECICDEGWTGYHCERKIAE